MKKVSASFLYLLLILVLYCYIFNPYPFRGGVIKLLYPFAIYPFFNKMGLNEIKKDGKMIFSLALIFLFDLFVLLRGGDSTYFNSLQNIVELVFIPIGIGLFYYKTFPKRDILQDVIIVCTIAGFISLYLALNPDLAFVSRQIFNKNIENLQFDLRRLYGISQFLLFTYSVLMGFVAAYCVLSKGYVKFLSIPILMGVLFNARIGFFIFFVAFVVMLVLRKQIAKNIPLLVAIAIFGGFAYTWVEQNFPETFEWFMKGYEETSNTIGGTRSGTFEVLFEMTVWPSGVVEWIVGSGKNILKAMDNNSDVGYFIQLNYGGLVYILLLFYSFSILLKKIKKNHSDKSFIIALILSLLIANYKGNVLTSNEFVRFLYLIAICYSIKNIIITSSREKLYSVNG